MSCVAVHFSTGARGGNKKEKKGELVARSKQAWFCCYIATAKRIGVKIF